jgi:hypothetical protein
VVAIKSGFLMPKKPKKSKKGAKKSAENNLWIAARFTLKGNDGDRAWDERRGGPPNGSRYLEYADIALGLKKVEPRKQRANPRSTHDLSKTDPYSQVK